MPNIANPTEKFVSPLEQQVFETFGLEPGLDRASILPVSGRRSEGNLELAAPQFVYDLAKAFMAPGVAATGYDVMPEESLNTALNVMGGGLGASQVAPAAGKSVVGMAVKSKGGEWLEGTIQDFTRPFKKAVPNRFDENDTYIGPDPERGGVQNEAVNNWIDTQLTKYIRNDMATPNDPVRKLADQGILHYAPDPVTPEGSVALLKGRTGTYGESDLAKAWELQTDSLVSGFPASTYTPNPRPESTYPLDVIARERPDTPIHQVYEGDRASGTLGFGHLTDELRNAVDPNNATGLPQNLQIKPDKLQKMNMEQAVRHVAKINKWREKNAEAANLKLANNPATHTFIDYGDGSKWVELKAPDDMPEGWKIEGDELVGPSGQRELIGERGDPRYKDVAEALKYEGDTMGHCVGGYCDEVIGGNTRIFSLRDAKGKPHTTIEVQQQTPFSGYDRLDHVLDRAIDFIPEDKLSEWVATYSKELGEPMSIDEAIDSYARLLKGEYGRYIDDPTTLGAGIMDEIVPGLFDDVMKDNPGFAITQIKGKGNVTPAAKYIPQIKDFIEKTGYKVYESGPWDE